MKHKKFSKNSFHLYFTVEFLILLMRNFNKLFLFVIFQLHSPVPFSGSFPRCSTLYWIF